MSAGQLHQPAFVIRFDPKRSPGATGDALLSATAHMKNSSIPIGLPDDFVCSDDEGLFAFISALHASVTAKVAAEQRRGTALAEIIVEVREMTRLAAREAPHPKPFSSHALEAIAKQAIAWCVESYRPTAVVGRG